MVEYYIHCHQWTIVYNFFILDICVHMNILFHNTNHIHNVNVKLHENHRCWSIYSDARDGKSCFYDNKS